MTTCPECGISLRDDFQFCPEDGAVLDRSSRAKQDATPEKGRLGSVVVLYCPACAAEYPLTFSECPLHHTALTRHTMPSRVHELRPVETQPIDAPSIEAQPIDERPIDQQPIDQQIADEEPIDEEPVHHWPAPRHLHLVTTDDQPEVHAIDEPPHLSGIEAYEAALDNLITQPVKATATVSHPLPHDRVVEQDEANKYRTTAIAVASALALLGLVGAYVLFTNMSRKPVKSAKAPVVAKTEPQQTIIVPTPQAALDYPDEASAAAPVASSSHEPRNNQATAEARTKEERQRIDEVARTAPKPVDEVESSAKRQPEQRSPADRREPVAAPLAHPAPVAQAQPAPVRQPAVIRQPAATELVLPRGTFGQIATRLTDVRASRTSGGYRYDLTFLLTDQIGQATQWERLAIVTHTANGAMREQQIPFYHRLGADGTMSFTVSVHMPGRAPADWQGRIICTSIGSDSRGRVHRASFGANVSPN